MNVSHHFGERASIDVVEVAEDVHVEQDSICISDYEVSLKQLKDGGNWEAVRNGLDHLVRAAWVHPLGQPKG